MRSQTNINSDSNTLSLYNASFALQIFLYTLAIF